MCSETALSVKASQNGTIKQTFKINNIVEIALLVTHSDLQCPDTVVNKNLRIHEGNIEGPKTGGVIFWPVLLTLPLIALLQVGYHDDGGWPLLPYQSPEVNQ